MGLHLNYETPIYIAPCEVLWRQSNQEHRGKPFSFLMHVSALGVFTSVTQHTGPMALRPIRRTKQWLSVLLKGTSVMTETRTHTLLIRNTRV